MTRPGLILIESIAGSGKSTIGQKLAAILQANNISAHFYHEFDRMHPIRELNSSDSDELIEKTVSRWRTFVNERQSTGIAIFDGVLSQCFIAELILMCADEVTIIEGVHRTIEIIKVLDLLVIYLYHDNIRELILKTYGKRNETWQKKIDMFIESTTYGKKRKLEGLSGYISFNREYVTLLNRIMGSSGLASISIETAQGEWAEYYRQIAEFLSIPSFENSSVKTLNGLNNIDAL